MRGRVINLGDELFGLDALNHAAWSRFALEVHADGLREYLLSSREGVRESRPTQQLRQYLHQVFNICRNAYDDWNDRQIAGLDIDQLLADAPSLSVTEPLLQGVREALVTGVESFYVATPQPSSGEDYDQWLDDYEEAISESPFAEVTFDETGLYDRALRYVPETRTLVINTQHPFVDKLISSGRNRGAATLFASSEVLTDVILRDFGFPRQAIVDFLTERDRVLRLLAGDQPSTASEVLRRLAVATRDETALERAVGAAFRVLGFEYERRGGKRPGPDGILYARLGRGKSEALSDYKLVYDAKQTNQPSVPADKINIGSLELFRLSEKADFGFFVSDKYDGEFDENAKVNRIVATAASGVNPMPVTLLKLDHLRRVIELHYRYGVTLTRLRSLFETAHTVPDTEKWVSELETELSDLEPQVPLRLLLEGIESAKTDAMARPNIKSVRAVDDTLKGFTPEKLTTALKAVETIVGTRWLEVDASSGDVKLHHNAEQVVAEVERNLQDMFGPGINAAEQPPVS